MLPINFLKQTLDRELGPANWEFNNNPVGDFFIVHHVGTGHIYKVQLISDAWLSQLWDGKQWVADELLSSPLNGKPTPLGFLSHAPSKHSADVRLWLHVDDKIISLAQLGPGFAILPSNHCEIVLAGSEAILEKTIDGKIELIPVRVTSDIDFAVERFTWEAINKHIQPHAPLVEFPDREAE